MKVTINHHHAVAVWKWELKPKKPGEAAADAGDSDGEDDDDDVCGICRVSYDGCCPDCKVPGDDCPLIWGECTHVFHMHCLLKWLGTESSKQQCPMDRRAWVTAGAAQPQAPESTASDDEDEVEPDAMEA